MSIEESVKIRRVSAIGIAIRYVSAVDIVSAAGVAIRHVFAIGIVSAAGIAIRHVSAIGIASAVEIAILPTGITIAQVRVAAVEIFQSHERAGLLADLLFHTRVILKIRIELRMALQELRVVDQGRRFAKLVGNFAMAIEKLIKSRQVPARDVIALDSLPILRGRGLRVHGTRDTQERRRRRTEN